MILALEPWVLCLSLNLCDASVTEWMDICEEVDRTAAERGEVLATEVTQELRRKH